MTVAAPDLHKTFHAYVNAVMEERSDAPLCKFGIHEDNAQSICTAAVQMVDMSYLFLTSRPHLFLCASSGVAILILT